MTVKPSVAELRARVETAQAELHASVETITCVIEDALDWKRAVRKHPIQAAALGLTLGFLVLRAPGAMPGLLKQVGSVGLKSLAGAGGGSIVNSLLRRFLPGR
ncbi:MAG: hypothetical protein SGI90_01495 [Candidatus Eisenbacteria bacterium]|nr:hypothetical protein [Candidatus Eisenbacteria bacterium]